MVAEFCFRAEGREPRVDILCPECGTENWLENQSRCLQCNAVLRRCADCSNYDGRKQFCLRMKAEIESREAQHPSVLSTSTQCRDFHYAGPRP